MTERSVSKSIVHSNLVRLPPSATILDAARTMTKANCGSVLIISPNGALEGIVTERDLMTRVLAKGLIPEKTLVSQVMTPNPHCVPPEMIVSHAVMIMIERGFRHLPIVTVDGKILGVFSARDALPREISDALSLAEFHDQMNDPLV
jgi:CBS domain-containing protein